KAVVHLVDISGTDEQQKPDSGVVHHVAFASQGFAGMKQRLQSSGMMFDARQVPGGALWQIFINDPNGVMIELNYEAAREQAAEAAAWDSVRAQAEAAVRGIPGVTTAMVALTAERKGGSATPPSRRPAPGVPPVSSHRPPQGAASPMSKQSEIPGIAAVIAVASGKGGVGKSTTALNLALGLRDLGLRVGLLDADIYGPSVPRLTGIREKPRLNDDRKMVPIQ